MKRDGGWLSVAGLFWLHEGANTFGKDAGNEIVLPDGAAKAGVFELHEGKVTVKMDGATRELWPDSLDVAKVGRLSLFVIKRLDKYGIRLKDPESEYRREFQGIETYPAKEEYKVTAKWVAAPQKIPILNILGPDRIHGQPRICGVPSARPGVSPSARIWKPPTPKSFSLSSAIRPAPKRPTARAAFSTLPCPRTARSCSISTRPTILPVRSRLTPPARLPPAENRLAVRIEAGEKKYGH